MGSHKSLIELNPGDLFSIDRHSLGPENPAHNVLVDSFYIDKNEKQKIISEKDIEKIILLRQNLKEH